MGKLKNFLLATAATTIFFSACNEKQLAPPENLNDYPAGTYPVEITPETKELIENTHQAVYFAIKNRKYAPHSGGIFHEAKDSSIFLTAPSNSGTFGCGCKGNTMTLGTTPNGKNEATITLPMPASDSSVVTAAATAIKNCINN